MSDFVRVTASATQAIDQEAPKEIIVTVATFRTSYSSMTILSCTLQTATAA